MAAYPAYAAQLEAARGRAAPAETSGLVVTEALAAPYYPPRVALSPYDLIRITLLCMRPG